jgi:hypothetical protein
VNDGRVPEPTLFARLADALTHGGYYVVTVALTVLGIVVFQIRADAVRDSRLSELEKQVARNAETATRLGHLEGVVNEARRNVATFIERQSGMLTRLAEGDSRFAYLDKHVVDLEGRTVTELKSVIDMQRAEMQRLESQQGKIVQALDNTYHTLQEALRNQAITPKPTPQP